MTLIGREHQHHTLLSLLRHRRLVTVTGPGGIGKTALARAVALACDPDAHLLDLSGPATWPERTPPRLLLLDTCDHVVDHCAELAQRLLDRFPALRILVTGREVLGIPGEHVTTAAPLDARHAAALFHERSGGLHADPGVLARLDGIPLAIEIAAEHLLDSAKLAELLDNGAFHTLAAGPGHPARHASMRAAAEWSHRLCRPPDVYAWSRLAAFETPFGLEEAERALNGYRPAAVSEAVARLVERSILVVDSAAADAKWYRMPFHLRAFTK
ncbi:AAA family ATPase [Nonomuraea typhae]|uniref:AAA family ATPase n=1 Tax=Nonomuraea typhae TaxID=2603600 RepID=UPI0015E1D942|nr:AAA family ATPase [Nonomuraea typhae]